MSKDKFSSATMCLNSPTTQNYLGIQSQFTCSIHLTTCTDSVRLNNMRPATQVLKTLPPFLSQAWTRKIIHTWERGGKRGLLSTSEDTVTLFSLEFSFRGMITSHPYRCAWCLLAAPTTSFSFTHLKFTVPSSLSERCSFQNQRSWRKQDGSLPCFKSMLMVTTRNEFKNACSFSFLKKCSASSWSCCYTFRITSKPMLSSLCSRQHHCLPLQIMHTMYRSFPSA